MKLTKLNEQLSAQEQAAKAVIASAKRDGVDDEALSRVIERQGIKGLKLDDGRVLRPRVVTQWAAGTPGMWTPATSSILEALEKTIQELEHVEKEEEELDLDMNIENEKEEEEDEKEDEE
jgi:hypothetical protein